MIKTVSAAVIVVVVLLGAWMWRSGKFASQPVSNGTVPAESSSKSDEKGMVESASDWLSAMASGKTMKCSYGTAIPGMGSGSESATVTMFVKGKQYRMETLIAGGQNIVVSDGQTMYTWSPETKQGTKMDLSCLESIKSPAPEQPNGGPNVDEYKKSPEDIVKEKPDIRCEAAGNVDFSIPSDVKFADQCAMLKQGAEMMKKYQDQIPQDIKGKLPAGMMPTTGN